MAYGKNPAVLGQTGSFRQVGKSWNNSRSEKKVRSSNIPSWVNEYRPPTDDIDTIRILAGDYTVPDVDKKGNLIEQAHLPFMPFIEHFDARSKRRSICSGGPYVHDKNKKEPCYGCDLFWSGMKDDPSRPGKKKPGFMGKRDMIAFTVIDYSDYHKIQQVDQSGQVRMNDNTNQPYYSWVKCTKGSDGRGPCDACDAGAETKKGSRLHWAMGSNHYNTLLAKEEEIGRTCAVCRMKNVVRSDAWLCANPECGDAIIDDKTRMSKKEIDDIVTDRARCPTCNSFGFLNELISCTNCTPAGKQPRRATLFDVDLEIRRIEAADGSNGTTLSISGFSDPHPVAKEFADMAKPEQLNMIYAPTELEKQAILFNHSPGASTRKPVTSSSAARPYGSGGGQGPDYGA